MHICDHVYSLCLDVESADLFCLLSLSNTHTHPHTHIHTETVAYFIDKTKLPLNAKNIIINAGIVYNSPTVTAPKEDKKRDFHFVCKGSKHLFSTLQLLYRGASFSREATAMGQRFLYQSDLIFQSIKSVISTKANTAIALQSACN